MPPSSERQLVDDGVAAWARGALERTGGLEGVRRVGLALVEGGGRRLQFTASDRDASDVPEWCHIDAYDDVPLNTAIRTGESVLGTLDDVRERYPGFANRQRGTGTHALAAIPIVASGQTLGGYVLFFDRPQRFTADHRQQLQTLGRELGAGLRRAQRHEERPTAGWSTDDVPPGASVDVHDVPPDPAAVGQARRFLRRALTAWGVDEDTTDTAVLCLSELVTNAVIHTRGGCAVRVLLDRGVLTTTVRDQGGQRSMATEGLEDPLRVHGRGLKLVDALATRWGSSLDADGTTVWFVLDLDQRTVGS